MKKQPSVEAAAEADLSYIHRAFLLPRLTESTADRWIKATTQLFLSLNGEENGKSSISYRCLSLELRANWLLEDLRDWSGGGGGGVRGVNEAPSHCTLLRCSLSVRSTNERTQTGNRMVFAGLAAELPTTSPVTH